MKNFDKILDIISYILILICFIGSIILIIIHCIKAIQDVTLFEPGVLIGYGIIMSLYFYILKSKT